MYVVQPIPIVRTFPRVMRVFNMIRPTPAVLTMAAVVVGVILRLADYLHNRSLWVDEIYLSLNITDRSFAELWRPLDHDQGAPVGFLMLVKFATAAFGSSEYALRLVPLLAGLAAMLWFPRVAGRLLPPAAACFATALFAVTPKLVHYASEVKQYSSDVFVTLLLFGLFVHRERIHFRVIAIAGAAALWFSHPALFVLAGLGLVMVAEAWFMGDRRRLKELVVVGGAWLASFALCYVLCLRELGTNQYLLNYWSEYFAPVPPRNFGELGWYLRAVSWIFEGPAGMSLADVSFAVPAAIVFVIGLRWLAQPRWFLTLGVLAPLAMALAASAVHRYPFGGRLLLFVVPLIHLGLGAAWPILRRSSLGLTLGLAVLIAPAAMSLQQLARPHVVEDNRATVQFIAQHWQVGDGVYLSSMAAEPFAFYGPRFGLEVNAALGKAHRDNWNEERDTVQRLAGRQRVWVFVTHDRSANHKFLLWQLDSIGTRLDEFTAPGSAAYLYDLSQH